MIVLSLLFEPKGDLFSADYKAKLLTIRPLINTIRSTHQIINQIEQPHKHIS